MNAQGTAKGHREFTQQYVADGGKKTKVNNGIGEVTEGKVRMNLVYQPRLPAYLTRIQGPMSKTQFDIAVCQLCEVQCCSMRIRHTAADVLNGLYNSCMASHRATKANAT